MRISDWSSDVCSSDLGGRGRFATLQQGQRILQREAIARRLDTSRHRVRERCPVLQVGRERQGDELASGLAVEPLPLAIVHQRLATGNPPQVERLRRGIVVRNQCDDGTGADTPGRPRSEEYTSELQSLMRISYALFCLQK